MKNMKRIVAVMLAVMALFVFAACGSSNTDTSDDSSKAVSQTSSAPAEDSSADETSETVSVDTTKPHIDLDVVGEWETSFDIIEMTKQEDPESAEYFGDASVVLDILITFDEDGNFSISAEHDDIVDFVNGYIDAQVDAMMAMYADMGTEIDRVTVESIFGDAGAEIEASFTEMFENSATTWYAMDGKLYFEVPVAEDESADESATQPEPEYCTYKLEDGRLILDEYVCEDDSQSFFNAPLYPLVLK